MTHFNHYEHIDSIEKLAETTASTLQPWKQKRTRQPEPLLQSKKGVRLPGVLFTVEYFPPPTERTLFFVKSSVFKPFNERTRAKLTLKQWRKKHTFMPRKCGQTATPAGASRGV